MITNNDVKQVIIDWLSNEVDSLGRAEIEAMIDTQTYSGNGISFQWVLDNVVYITASISTKMNSLWFRVVSHRSISPLKGFYDVPTKQISKNVLKEGIYTALNENRSHWK